MKRFSLLLLLASLFFYLPLKGQSGKPQEVLTGVYLMNVYDLNLDEHSFFADFYIWFKWRGDIDPTEIEFVNMVEKWGMTMEPFEDTILTLSDGWNYQGYRVEGRFFHPFLLERFPLDKHTLEIHIENPDYPTEALRYVPDTTSPPIHIRPDLMLAGWDILGSGLTPMVHSYGTDFGNPDDRASTFSDLVFTFRLTRPLSYFVLKLLLPLTIVILAALGALLFFPSYVDARISLPVGSLLTAVFLQQSYSDALPDVGYMVLMDKIYLLAYLLIATIILRLILTGNRLREVKKKQMDFNQLKRRERWMAGGFLMAYLLGVLLLVWLA